MKKVCLLVVVALVAVVAVAEGVEVSGSGVFYLPEDFWSGGYGAEVRGVIPCGGSLSVAGTLGFAHWKVKEVSGAASGAFEMTGVAGEEIYSSAQGGFRGSANLIPIGVSLLYDVPVEIDMELTIEAGPKFVIVDDNIEVYGDIHASSNFSSRRKDMDVPMTLEMSHGLVGVIAANLAKPIQDNLSVVAGLGYQFNMPGARWHFDSPYMDYTPYSQGMTWWGGLSALYGRVGLRGEF